MKETAVSTHISPLKLNGETVIEVVVKEFFTEDQARECARTLESVADAVGKANAFDPKVGDVYRVGGRLHIVVEGSSGQPWFRPIAAPGGVAPLRNPEKFREMYGDAVRLGSVYDLGAES
jgi:hypothetical protein